MLTTSGDDSVQQQVQQPERLLPIARNRYAPLPGITAAEPVAGIVLGMVVFGASIRVSRVSSSEPLG